MATASLGLSAAAASAAAVPIVRNLNAQRVYQVRPGLREVPLLCPRQDPGIPIAATIQIFSDDANSFTPFLWEHLPDAYMISYVLAGTGKLSVRPRSSGRSGGHRREEINNESVKIGMGDSVLLLPGSHFSLVPALESSSLGHTCSLLTDPQGLIPNCSLVTLTITIPAKESLAAITSEDIEQRPVRSSTTLDRTEAECLGTLSTRATDALLESPLAQCIRNSNHRRPPSEPMPMVLQQLEDLTAYSPPNSTNTNKLALVFDPISLQEHFVSFTFAVEELDPGHVIPSHSHNKSVELFVCLKGHGSATLRKGEIDVEQKITPGSIIAIPPDFTHSLYNSNDSPMYLLELMFPNEEFAEFVRSGLDQGPMTSEDLCALIQVGCAQ